LPSNLQLAMGHAHCSNEKYTWKDPTLQLTPEKIRNIIIQARDMDIPVS